MTALDEESAVSFDQSVVGFIAAVDDDSALVEFASYFLVRLVENLLRQEAFRN